jgi:hypothetical protein
MRDAIQTPTKRTRSALSRSNSRGR